MAMTTELTLRGETEYNSKFPPRGAKKGYVARIDGRECGPRKYAREFLGQEATLLEGDEGLYERQIGEKKGGARRYYHVVLNHPDYGLICSVDCEPSVPRIAKMLDDGHEIQDIVAVENLRPGKKELMTFDVRVRTASMIKSHVQAATVESAVTACWEVVRSLSPKDAKEVLSGLRSRLAEQPSASAAGSPAEK